MNNFGKLNSDVILFYLIFLIDEDIRMNKIGYSNTVGSELDMQ